MQSCSTMLLSVLLCLVLVIGILLVSCEKDPTTSDQPDTPTATTPDTDASDGDANQTPNENPDDNSSENNNENSNESNNENNNSNNNDGSIELPKVNL